MIVSDRFLVALGEYFKGVASFELVPRLRDWTGTKGPAELVLDADEPEEHEGMDGVYAVDAMVILKVRARDLAEETRRDMLAELRLALVEENSGGELKVIAWLNDPENERGLEEGEGLKIYDLRNGDGVWEHDGKYLNGKIEISAMVCGPGELG